MTMSKPVLFYGHKVGPYICFSNFYPAKFVYDGITWACSEQAFMYYKSTDKDYQKKVLATTDPYKVKKLGREADLVSNWDEIKYNIMYEVVLAKFSANEALREILLSTGDSVIHEDCNDKWWGGGPNHPSGRDWLGKILMKVRSKLRE